MEQNMEGQKVPQFETTDFQLQTMDNSVMQTSFNKGLGKTWVTIFYQELPTAAQHLTPHTNTNIDPGTYVKQKHQLFVKGR